MAEYLTVDQAVVGSTPIRHPIKDSLTGVFYHVMQERQSIAAIQASGNNPDGRETSYNTHPVQPQSDLDWAVFN
jgi:hypothetical protein